MNPPHPDNSMGDGLRFYLQILFVSGLVTAQWGCTMESANGSKGILDLSGRDFNTMFVYTDSSTKWKAWPDKILSPRQIRKSGQKPLLVEDRKFEESFFRPGFGRGTYGITVRGGPENRNKSFIVLLSFVPSAYRVWADDKLLAESGTVDAGYSRFVATLSRKNVA